MVLTDFICPPRALNNAEKTRIYKCLLDLTGSSTKLSLALVSLRTTELFNCTPTTGALAFVSRKESNGDSSFPLMFFGLNGGTCSWFHALSAQSKLERTGNSTLKYLLIDPVRIYPIFEINKLCALLNKWC